MPDLRDRLPYFDHLFALLKANRPEVQTAFSRHVHWGYWPQVPPGRVTPEDYAQAAERLSMEVCRAGGIGEGMNVLDVGCGFGGTIAGLNERHSGMRLTGVNIDPRQLERAQQIVTAAPGNTVRWVQADACQLPFENASFDAVLAVECIFHFPSRAAFFAEARRVLKPGGRLAISDFVPAGLLAWWGGFRAGGFYGRSDLSCTRNAYEKLAKAKGFRPCEDRDITRGTLPTYPFLLSLRREIGLGDRSAGWQTWLLGFLSRRNLLQYRVMSWEAV